MWRGTAIEGFSAGRSEGFPSSSYSSGLEEDGKRAEKMREYYPDEDADRVHLAGVARVFRFEKRTQTEFQTRLELIATKIAELRGFLDEHFEPVTSKIYSWPVRNIEATIKDGEACGEAIVQLYHDVAALDLAGQRSGQLSLVLQDNLLWPRADMKRRFGDREFATGSTVNVYHFRPPGKPYDTTLLYAETFCEHPPWEHNKHKRLEKTSLTRLRVFEQPPRLAGPAKDQTLLTWGYIESPSDSSIPAWHIIHEAVN